MVAKHFNLVHNRVKNYFMNKLEWFVLIFTLVFIVNDCIWKFSRAKHSQIYRWYRMIITNIYSKFEKLVQLSKFPKVESIELEQKKLGLFRITLGILILNRTLLAEYSYFIFSGELSAFTFITLVSTILFTIGLFTPFSTILLFFFVRAFEMALGINSLGTAILQIVLLIFMLTNTGQYYSIDNYFLKKNKILKYVYNIFGTPNKKEFTSIYFLGLIVYATISFGAMAIHAFDYNWTTGLTTRHLLTNNYFSNEYELFKFLDIKFPIAFTLLSMIASLGQSIFQLFMIPMVFFSYGKSFVKYWGLQFFLISFFFIGLDYLPYVELILWIIIFSPISINSNKVKILYDDHCNLCKKTMMFFKKINFNGRYEFLAVSKNKEIFENYNLNEKEVKSYMVGLYDGRVYKGYSLYGKILILNPLLWIFLPLFFLGKLFKLGDKIYNFIAENRYKTFGKCELSFHDQIALENKIIPVKSFHYQKIIILMYIFCTFMFSICRYPYISKPAKDFFRDKPSLLILEKNIFIRLGFVIPYVFNTGDLNVGYYWMTIYEVNKFNQKRLVPLFKESGQRTNYENFNILYINAFNSPFLYNNFLSPYRRGLSLSLDPVEYHKYGNDGFGFIKNLVQYDYNKMALNGEKIYMVRAFKMKSDNLKHWVCDTNRYKKEIIYESSFKYNGTKFEEIINLM